MKPKVLAIGPIPPPIHGVSVLTEKLVKSKLAHDSFNWFFLDISDRRNLNNLGQFEFRNVTLALLHFIQYIRLLVVHKPDLIYMQISQGFWGYIRDLLFLLPARFLNKPTIVHFHGAAFDDFYKSVPGWMKFLIRFSLAKTKRMIVLGKGLRYLFTEMIPEERIVAVYNGADGIVEPGRLVEKIPHEYVVILFLGTLVKRKGIFLALDALKGVMEQRSNVRAVFAGTWGGQLENESLALQKVAEWGLEDKIRFVGLATGSFKQQLFLDSDIFLFPPIETEGVGLVLLEAMSSQLSIVTTCVGAIPEYMVDGVTGYVLKTKEPGPIVEKLIELVDNPDLRDRMGIAGRKKFLELYTTDRWVEGVVQVINDALAEVANQRKPAKEKSTI